MALLNVNLSETEAQETLKPLPPGWYNAMISDSEVKEGGKGAYIKWTFDVDNQPNKVWEIMSLSSEGEAVGLRKLKTLAVCSGHPDPNFIRDTEELHGKRCQIRLKIEEDPTGAYEPKNKITTFKPLNGESKIAVAVKKTTQQQYTTPAPEPIKEPAVTPWGSEEVFTKTAALDDDDMPF